VESPRDSAAYLRYFCAKDSGNADQLKDNEPKRLKLYKFAAALLRAYASIASELAEAGYKADEIEKIKAEVDHYTKVRDEVKLASGDYIDLKAYEPAMRHLIDTYIRAEESEKISAFDDMSLIQLIVERGPDAVNTLPKGIRKSQEAVAETIENNVRKLIINESPVDPAYYEKMSKLLDALIEQRRKGVVSYKEYLVKIAKLTREATMPGGGPGGYPANVKTAAQRALYNNLDKKEGLALAVDAAIQGSRQDGWKDNPIKMKRVRNAIKAVLAKASAKDTPSVGFSIQDDISHAYAIDSETTRILELAKHQHDY
jgi:type I restriction enzyme R subunit